MSRRLAVLILTLSIAFAATAPWTAPSVHAAGTADKTTLFVNLTTDDAWTAQMAFTYADKVLDTGHPVVVFLNVRAVRLADRNIPHHRGGLSGKAPAEMLKSLMAKGATVYVCPSCTTQAGMTKADWIDGVKAGGPDTIEVQMAQTTKVMSY